MTAISNVQFSVPVQRPAFTAPAQEAVRQNAVQSAVTREKQTNAEGLAPAEPSPQDVQVAQQAQQTKLQAQAELRQQRAEEAAERRGEGGSQNGLLAALQAFSDAEKTAQRRAEDITGILLDVAV